MVIDVYCMMWNEAALLPFWLRHYGQVADRLFVWDDASTDGTRALLCAHPKVRLLEPGRLGLDDDYRVAHLFPQYEVHSRGVADWVMAVDADEFVYHPRLRQVLRAELDRGTHLVQCAGYAMVAEAFPVDDGRQLYEQVRLGLPDYLESKWVVHSPNVRVRFRKGRHSTVLNHRALGLVRSRRSGLRLLHYRYFGEAYYLERNRRNHERGDQTYHHGVPFDPHSGLTMPDRLVADPLDWYAQHKGQAVSVVDEEGA